jgi:CheY-like chemotaxis protein
MAEVGNQMMTESSFESAADLFLNVKPSISVLFIDDEPAFSTSVKQCLELVGSLCIETASSADEAIEKMKEKYYDVIVSDHQMPGKDGIQFLKELRGGVRKRALCASVSLLRLCGGDSSFR